MKIRFLIGVSGPRILAGRGSVKDLPPAEAKYWVREGMAEFVEEEAKATVQQVKKKSTRPVSK